ncbi:MAG: hypothetical protein WCS75_11010, partial [Sphingomonas sp.]
MVAPWLIACRRFIAFAQDGAPSVPPALAPAPWGAPAVAEPPASPLAKLDRIAPAARRSGEIAAPPAFLPTLA